MRRAIVSAMLAAGLVLATTGAVLAEDINGTPGDDELIGNEAESDNIWGRAGDDTIAGLSGADNLFGNASNDTICGGPDEDTYSGGWGNDILTEILCEVTTVSPTGVNGGLNDVMRGDKGADYIESGDGDDWIHGGRGSENITIVGQTLPLLYGGPGDDYINGGRESDAMEGEAGDDTLKGGKGQDFIDAANDEGVGDVDDVDCGPGYDTAIVNTGDTYARCEDVTIVPDPTLETSVSSTDARQDRARRAFLRANFD
jgi:Ca2+-binding RTX toxin-like protein